MQASIKCLNFILSTVGRFEKVLRRRGGEKKKKKRGREKRRRGGDEKRGERVAFMVLIVHLCPCANRSKDASWEAVEDIQVR